MSGIHVMHEGRGDSWTLYFGRHRGARYVSVDIRGFDGWTSRPMWMPGGSAFFNPRLSVGRLYMDCSRDIWTCEILLPSRLVDFYRWKIRPSGRRYMREHGHEQPEESA